VPDQYRYEAISRFIGRHPTDFFVPTTYLSQGILVSGQWHPIIKMQWKQGQTLGAFIERHIGNPQTINDVLVQFQNLAATLERLETAHGDLQHGNIIVSNERLFLVDYDGMFVPELSGSEAKERGHPNYQHPVRDRDFGPYLDRFSIIVIYLALKGLAVNPGLWDKYSTGENLLFRQKDFLSPDTSSLLSDLEVTPTMRPLVERFRIICKINITQVPTLADFLSGKMPGILPEGAITATRWGQYEIVAAEQRLRLLEIVGERLTVVGKISEYYQGTTKYNKPYVFLSFGDWQREDCRLVIWSEALELFQSKGKDLKSYEGAWVSVTGLLTEYQKGDWPKRPQIEVESPAEVEVLSGPEEAKQRLSGQTSTRPSTPLPTSTTKPSSPHPPISSGNLELAREHFVRAWNYDEQEGRLDKAIKEYQSALRIDPAYADAHNNLGWIYERQGRLDEAVAEYENAIQLDPNSIVTYRNLGRVYGKKKRFDEAIKSLLAALEIDPNDASTHFQLGWVYGEKGRLDKAITEYQAALQVNPELEGAYVNMGWAYSQQGRHDDAIREYKNAIQINSENRLAHFNLGCLYRIKGQTEDARRELELALKLGYEPARKVLQEIKGAK
jgi:tetratricopeptide (TPR) repeat protein